ncbi:MAG: hypothetical protein ACRCWY_07395 [Cellulosilyticaceae bacterium]
MSPLAQEVIETLAKEEDTALLAEVLDFYEYVKAKKNRGKWQNIPQVEPTSEEVKICNQYKEEEHEWVDFEVLAQELGIDD